MKETAKEQEHAYINVSPIPDVDHRVRIIRIGRVQRHRNMVTWVHPIELRAVFRVVLVRANP
jgi:hypothetical protein